MPTPFLDFFLGIAFLNIVFWSFSCALRGLVFSYSEYIWFFFNRAYNFSSNKVSVRYEIFGSCHRFRFVMSSLETLCGKASRVDVGKRIQSLSCA